MKQNLDNNQKDQAIEQAMLQVQKKYGKGAIMKMGEAPTQEIESFRTGSISLDEQLGIGGLPKGRIVEIYGPESSGKTTLTLHCIAEVQKAGGKCVFIDAEHAIDPVYAKAIGVNTDELYISQPDSGEQALEICETMVNSNGVDLIVVDSVAALVPQAEIDGDMGDSHMGLQARLN
jgi:recombination protein RecA